MGIRESFPVFGAIEAADISAVETAIADKPAADDGDWFADMAQDLLAPKAGTALHYITGFDERSCQRYAAGTVKPPAYFLRALLRSPQGAQVLEFLMQDSDAPWWRGLVRARRIAAAEDQIDRS